MFRKGYVVFSMEGKELCAYDLAHSYPGEMTKTKELLAGEKGVPSENILVEYFPVSKYHKNGFQIGKGSKVVGEQGATLLLQEDQK